MSEKLTPEGIMAYVDWTPIGDEALKNLIRRYGEQEFQRACDEWVENMRHKVARAAVEEMALRLEAEDLDNCAAEIRALMEQDRGRT